MKPDGTLTPHADTRRQLLRAIAGAAGIALTGCVGRAGPRTPRLSPERGGSGMDEAEVTPGEDLMQEHAVLERVLLIYEESAGRLERRRSLDVAVVSEGAGIVRRFVEDYHERLEEEHVFPRLEAARSQLELVAILREQHRRGRELTDEVLRLTRPAATTTVARSHLARILRGFSGMYRPHAAREDTVLFPAFRDVLGRAGYRELGEQFEEREHALFGEDGFAAVVADVARLEQRLGIHDLARFTIRDRTSDGRPRSEGA